MPKLIAALILAGSLCAACDTAEATAAASANPTARASSSAGAAASPASVAPATSVPPPTAAPKTAAPTAAPATPAPATPVPAKPAPTVSAVPTRGARGSTFVFQFSGFPSSALGVDIVQTLTLPTGAKLASTTFLANPNGTGFTTYTPNVNDPAGQYVVTLQVAGGSVSTFAIINVF